MEKKFESELGKRIVEGNTRKSSKKVILGIAAIGACALLFGAASFSFAMGANATGPSFITENVLFDHEVSELTDTETGDADAKRVMSLKYRSTAPPGDNDLGNTKFVYVINIVINSTDGYEFIGMNVGNLVIGFDAPVAYNALVTVYTTGIANQGELPEAFSVTTTPATDDTTDGVDVTAIIPSATLLDGSAWVPTVGDTVSITITVDIAMPNLTGTATETAWPGSIFEPVPVDFPIVEEA